MTVNRKKYCERAQDDEVGQYWADGGMSHIVWSQEFHENTFYMQAQPINPGVGEHLSVEDRVMSEM